MEGFLKKMFSSAPIKGRIVDETTRGLFYRSTEFLLQVFTGSLSRLQEGLLRASSQSMRLRLALELRFA